MVHWEETFMSAFFASSTASHGQIWDVDIYVRASREDGDKEQSETISNQITMLTDLSMGGRSSGCTRSAKMTVFPV